MQYNSVAIFFSVFMLLELSAGTFTGPATAQTCDEIDKLVTTTSAPPSNADRWRVYLKESRAAVRGTVGLVLLGDSLAEAWDVKKWLPLQAVNLGVGGDRTQQTLWRLSSEAWLRIKPRDVLIMLGTNNLSAGDDVCAITAGLRKVIWRARAIWPTSYIAFLEIPPRGNDFVFDNDVRKQVNEAMRLIPDLKTINADDEISCSWKQPCRNYAADKLHFSDAGYEVLLKTIKGVLFGRGR